MSRRYGPVGTSIWDSEKFNDLATDLNQLAYLYLLACPHGNSLGVFKLPAKYLSVDLETPRRRVSIQDAEAIIADLERAGLVQRGPDHWVRIIDWFWQETGANNPSTISAFCRNFKDRKLVKPGPLRTAAIGEMIVASLSRAESWNPDTRPFDAMIKDVLAFLQAELKRDPEGIRQSICDQPEPDENTVSRTMLDTVSNTVFHTMWTPTPTYEHGNGDKKEKRGQDTGTGTGTGTEIGSQSARERKSPPPASPAGGRRSGGRVPVDVQEEIDRLNRKRKGET